MLFPDFFWNLPRFHHFRQEMDQMFGGSSLFQRLTSVCSRTRVLTTAPTPKDPSNVPVTEITRTSTATAWLKVAADLQTPPYVSMTTVCSVHRPCCSLLWQDQKTESSTWPMIRKSAVLCTRLTRARGRRSSPTLRITLVLSAWTLCSTTRSSSGPPSLTPVGYFTKTYWSEVRPKHRPKTL